MYKKLRKKIATSLSEIEGTDDFAYGKWLKEPQHKDHKIESPHTSVFDTTSLNNYLEKPPSEKYGEILKEADVLPELKKAISKKIRTNAVFFNFGTSDITRFKLSDYEAAFLKRKLREINFKSKLPKIKDIKWKSPSPRIANSFKRLEPNVLKVDLLDPQVLSGTTQTSTGENLVLNVLDSPLKIYNVKIPGIDKIKLGKIYFLKNIKPNTSLLNESFYPINKTGVTEQNLDLLGVVWEEEVIPSKDGIEPIEQQDELFDDVVHDFVDNMPVEEISLEDLGLSDINFDNIKIEHLDLENLNLDDLNLDDSILVDEQTNLTEEFDNTVNVTLEEETNEELPQTELESVETDEAVHLDDETDEVEDSDEEEDIAEPIKTFTDYENDFSLLYSYQETGAEFLIDERYALLSDNLGLGKTVQAVSALKNLFAANKIKSAVIVCSKNEIGSISRLENTIDGWIGHLNCWAQDLSILHINGTPHERSSKWKESAQVYLSTYESFFFDIEENVIDKKKLKSVECFIFDEAQNLFRKVLNSDKFNKSIKPQYIWALSSYPSEIVKGEINSVFIKKFAVESVLKRSKAEVSREIPFITWQENWTELDELQLTEYSDSLRAAKEKVNWLIESGNPLRFQANIFTILHQLKQVCNFADKSDTSPKTDLLLGHVDNIAKNKKKVIIFSQYDKLGTKKIEALFKKNSIKYVTYAAGMSTKEMESATKNFASDNTITAMIAGVKSSRIKLPACDVSYIIHFDQWWNPASLWQTEELVTALKKENGLNEPVNVYSYLTKGTIEEKISSLLFRKGFLNKNIMDLFGAEHLGEMIANEEWLEIFDMPDSKFNKETEKKLKDAEKKLVNLSQEDFIETVKIFLTKLGIKKPDAVDSENGNFIDVKGTFSKSKIEALMVARILLNDKSDSNEIQSHLSDLKELTKKGKAFILTRGSFDEENPAKHNPEISLLDKKSLSNYYYQFRVLLPHYKV